MTQNTENRDLYYAERLAEMIRCKTVSKKDEFEGEEIFKLREVIGGSLRLTA